MCCCPRLWPWDFYCGDGCAWVHDHPGIRSMSWLSVRYPGGQRFDLGLLEMLFLALLAVCFLLLGRKPRAPGFFAGWTFVIYGSFRVGLDQSHANPPRWMGIRSSGSCLPVWGCSRSLAPLQLVEEILQEGELRG